MLQSICTILVLTISIQTNNVATAFVVSPHHQSNKGRPSALTPAFSVLDSFRAIFDKSSTTTTNQAAVLEDNQKRVDLKEKLMTECQSNEDKAKKREKIEALIEELAPLSPVVGTARSPLLQKEWLLVWTTEKEINFFSDWNISGEITQSINNSQLGNMIEFKKGGGLGVTGQLSFPDDNDELGIRTNFKFTTASLDLGRWGKYNLPPVGEGWFDTLYLDEELRIDVNSRDDILICTPL